MTVALEGGELSAARPDRTLPPGKTQYPFYRRLGGPQGRYGWAENLVLTRIRSQTFQPVVSRYTDWATRPTQRRKVVKKNYQRLEMRSREYVTWAIFVPSSGVTCECPCSRSGWQYKCIAYTAFVSCQIVVLRVLLNRSTFIKAAWLVLLFGWLSPPINSEDR